MPLELEKPAIVVVEEHLRPETACQRLDIEPRTLRKYIAAGRASSGRRGIYPVFQISRKLQLIPASAINRFIQRGL